MNYTPQLELMYSPTITYFLNIFTMALASIGLTVSSTTWFHYGRGPQLRMRTAVVIVQYRYTVVCVYM